MTGLDDRLAARLSEIKARLQKERDTAFSSQEHWGPSADANQLPTDPNYGWHLGAINVEDAWADYTGAGITVGVIDDGINHNHADLDDNYNTAIDWDARDNDDDADSSASGDGHGTKVAGVIAAEANGVGGVGIAYESEIAGFRIGYGSAGSIFDIEEAISKSWAVSDVVNSSWGYSTAFQDSFKKFGYSQAGQALEDGVAEGRDGLGTVFVFSAGNERGAGQDVNYHNFQNSPYTIAVAATTSSGKYASFSNPGAALHVAAPGYAIKTTSDGGGYTSSSGTSFAAPIVSGVVALMLEANPELGYRDVQEILAYSAQYNDATNTGWQDNGADNFNGGGLHFNHNYGFGLVDAEGAVRLAETWTMQRTFANQLSESKSSAPGVAIPDGGSSGVSDTIRITRDMEIDTVEVDLQIDHTRVGDLVVVLVSPDGTEATLASRPGGSGNGANNINFVFSANSFWGENAAGDWTLKVYDKATGEVGSFESWTLTLNGDAVSSDDTYIYNDDYAAMADGSREVLRDTDGGIDTINASQVSTDSLIDLNAGMTSTLAGAPLVIAADTVIENVFLGDGNDTLVGNDADNEVLGGRGDDTLDGGAGTDTARFFGELENYDVIIVDGSTVTVTFTGVDGIDEGTDTLTNFENFDFGGVVYSYDDLAVMYGAPVNNAPVLAAPIADQPAAEDAAFSFVLPQGTFTDVDEDALTLTATLADGSELPAWLSFDAATGTFSGTPAQSDVDDLDIKVTATDPSGAAVSDTFRISVSNTNDAPVLALPVSDQVIQSDQALDFTLPEGTFVDGDPGDSLTLTATLADGSALPSWLAFDAATGTFSGTPAFGDIGDLAIKVTATDMTGESATTSFNLAVQNGNTLAEITGANADAGAGTRVAFTTLFDVSDADGDAITQVDLGNAAGASGYWELDGAEVTGIVALDGGTGGLNWVAGDETTTDQVSVRVFDGKEWSAEATADVNATPEAVGRTSFAFTEITEVPGESVGTGSLFDYIQSGEYSGETQVQIYVSPDAAGQLMVNGEVVGNDATLTMDEFLTSNWQVGADGSEDKLWMRVNEGSGWDDWMEATVTSSTVVNAAPVIDVTDATVDVGAEVMASTLFAVSDAEGDAITQYEIWSGAGDTGHWEVGGVNAGAGGYLSADQFDDLVWVSGEAGSVEDIWIRARDGDDWSEWVAADITVDVVGVSPDSDPFL